MNFGTTVRQISLNVHTLTFRMPFCMSIVTVLCLSILTFRCWRRLPIITSGRALEINKNSKPNIDILPSFYSYMQIVLQEFKVDHSIPKPCKFFDDREILNTVTPVRPTSQIKWDASFRSLNWTET